MSASYHSDFAADRRGWIEPQIERLKAKSLHGTGFGLEVFVEGNLEVEQFVAVGVAQLVQVQFGAFERIVEFRDVVEQETCARGMRLDYERAVFKLVEICLDLFVAAFGL